MEMIDVYDSDTELKTGEVISKDEAHEKGIWHSAVHIIITSKDSTKVLLQKRCEDKKLFPNMWDIALGGHISSGEDSLVAAGRELKEELGLDINSYDVNYVGITKEEFYDNGINSKEIVFIYLIQADIDINDIKLQMEEVSDVAWYSRREFEKLISEEKMIKHEKEIEMIRNILQ